MPKRQPYKYLKREAHRGKIRWRFRRVIDGVEHKVTLPDYPGSSREAETAYFAALENRPVTRAPGEGRFAGGTFGNLCGRYLASHFFLKLTPATQHLYRLQIDPLRKEFGAIPLTQFRRKHIIAILERRAGKPGSANNVLRVLKILFNYAVHVEEIAASPAAKIKRFEVGETGGGSETWTDEHATMFRARWPLGSPQRTCFEIMWSTGLRIGDALLLGPQHVRDGRVRMVTSKKGEPINHPILPDLAEALAAVPARHLTYLATQGGRTRSAKAAYTWFSDAAKAAGLPPGYTAHGCRKALLTAAADRGASEHQLAAIAGHGSTRSVAPYVKRANQARLADAGLSLLERTGEDGNGTRIGPPSKNGGQKRPQVAEK